MTDTKSLKIIIKSCEQQIRVKTFENQKNKKVIFSDFYCLINTKFWITNEKMFIKQKSLLVMYIASFLQLSTTNKSKNIQKSKK